MKKYIFTLLCILTTSSYAELVQEYIPISCPGKVDVKVQRSTLFKFSAMVGNGDFMPIISSNSNVQVNNLYVIDGVAQKADYIAAIIWSSGLNKLGISCYFEVSKIYTLQTGKELSEYYKKAVIKGLEWKP